MIEKKFRGFSEQQNKWIYGGYHKPFEDIVQIIEITKSNASQMSLIKNGTEGQFTGLKDCKGVDIYEGDIVKNWGINYLVEYELYDCSQGFSIDAEDDDLEVIGNLYENPELL